MTHHSDPVEKLPRGTVAVPAASIGVMTLVLAVGFQSVGLLDRADTAMLGWIKAAGIEGAPVMLSAWLGWLVALVVAFGLPMAILETPTHWRRTVVWIAAIAVVAAVWPVLAVSAKWWPVTPSLVAVVWSGLCAKIYASRHHMPCEGGDAGRRLKRGHAK
ncbi:hypothetical protein KBB96_06860 [Luteolibacter ambystomatis]|uniref:Uncharacterized protein n=1 Tax=Luteolibacter ambystomatis TaxID=2824561 RepID=A0A975J230_9BACT|nr:hypothetical protein [Luteolibacter ambystomatis]QUE52608.1 hypothetical protein KBB96_06860 [Luteolibacter ambystomatis]